MHTTRLLAAVVTAASLSLVAISAEAGRILPFSGAGTVIATPCTPEQQDPAEFFALTSSNSGYLLEPGLGTRAFAGRGGSGESTLFVVTGFPLEGARPGAGLPWFSLSPRASPHRAVTVIAHPHAAAPLGGRVTTVAAC